MTPPSRSLPLAFDPVRVGRRVVILALCGALGLPPAALGEALASVGAGAAGRVKVQIVEGLPDILDWNFTNSIVSETYAEPAFAFPALPTRYSDQGIRQDRKPPFLIRGTAAVQLPAGEHRLLLRARGAARLKVDGRIVASTPFASLTADGHEEVPATPALLAPGARYLRPGHFETLVSWTNDGQPHEVTLEGLIAHKARRPEPGELSVSVAAAGESFFVLAPSGRSLWPLTEAGWDALESERRDHWRREDRVQRRRLAARDDAYWRSRHEEARAWAEARPPTRSAPASNGESAIDQFLDVRMQARNVRPARVAPDSAFLRRLSLDIRGVPPTPEEIDAFQKDAGPDRRARVIDRMLDDPAWADHWTSYWQDVLAENPGIVKPMLNNTGPFRWWIHDALSDNEPFDRFATDLVMMQGSAYYGGPAGFAIATDNDVPMAQKAQVLAQAFLGMQMQCARCHDAPYHHFKQEDLFHLAAMLKRDVQPVPLTSTIPTNANVIVGRKVKVTLAPGSKVEPRWPLRELTEDALPEGVLRQPADSRERLAALITSPRNERFARVIVNRMWKRFFGWGIVEPVDDWETALPSDPALLDFLAREFMMGGYDLKRAARLILNTRAYQREAKPEGSRETKPEDRMFASQCRRRMTAEQVVDSLFAICGEPFGAEELNMDVDGRRPVQEFNNLGRPERAWQFASLSNERDRPALSMPRAQQICDALTAFGWRESRQSAVTVREESPNVIQPAVLANGLLANGRVVRLSDDHAVTRLCLSAANVEWLVDSVFVRVLSREPTDRERSMFAGLLAPGFDQRRVAVSPGDRRAADAPLRPVSWSNHLNPEATRLKQEMENRARAGDVATPELTADWRERMEDFLWALINSPEFVFVP
ncbi:MAG: DUF1553 domain-containing protein [Verrucomicrobia bacterium]|nr:DUF1553 domain-containing protein [Verrucomicrobiota bacterium]